MYSLLEFPSGSYLSDQSIYLFIDPFKELQDICKVGLPFTGAMYTSQVSHNYACVHYILLICPYKHMYYTSVVLWILAKIFWKTGVTFDFLNAGKDRENWKL